MTSFQEIRETRDRAAVAIATVAELLGAPALVSR
jgi:hypothetical protein